MLSTHIINRYKEFLSHGMNHDEALYIARMMFELLPKGFERYVAAYFHEAENYKTEAIGGYEDGGIDIEGSKQVGYQSVNIAIQCKKWTSRHIKKKEILDFDDDVKHRDKLTENTQKYFVTTERVNQTAKDRAKELGVIIYDCWRLLIMKSQYSLDTFEEKFTKNKYAYDTYKDRFFTKTDVKGIIEKSLIM